MKYYKSYNFILKDAFSTMKYKFGYFSFYKLHTEPTEK